MICDPAELVARVRALARRVGPVGEQQWHVGDLVVDEPTRRVTRSGAEISLSPIEHELLCRLLRQQGRVVTQTQLLSDVWGYGLRKRNVLHAHMSSLRQKLEAHGERLIHTVRATGYVLRSPEAPD